VSRGRLLVLLVVVVAIASFFASGAHRYFTFEHVKAEQARLAARFGAHPLATAAGFFVLYVAVAALALPGAALLTLVAGAIFGFVWGTVLVSFASSIGATLSFLLSRFVLRDWVRRRYASRVAAMDRGMEKEGAFYLFTLRLIPAIPFFVVNVLMGLTALRTRTFYWVSQVGMFAGTLAYVNAGTQLAAIQSPRGILSPGLIGAFVVLGFFPLVAKRAVEMAGARPV
jgi:uncharacterized membrane protein YdjX (TVP38/TMEM64 family)